MTGNVAEMEAAPFSRKFRGSAELRDLVVQATMKLRHVILNLVAGVLAACAMPALSAVAPAYSTIKILVVQGNGEEIGRSHGEQLGPQIRLLQQRYLQKWFTDPKVKQKALLAAFVFRNQLSADHKAEIGGLAAGSGIDPGDAMLANCFLDLS